MGLKFKLSRNHVNRKIKTNQLLSELLYKDDVETIYYLIPDNLKFESEINVLSHLKETQSSNSKMAGMIDLQVYSFTRLAWHLLSDSSILNQTRLSQTGLTILVKKIMLDILKKNDKALKVFRGQEKFNGFITNLTALLMELRNGLIEPADLQEFIKEAEPDTDTYRKLNDLSLVYTEFLSEIENKYLEREDIMKALIDTVNQIDLSKTIIVIDHYENFSSQELELIEALLMNCKDVYINLTLDKAYPNNIPNLLDLFYLSGKTYHTLFKLAKTIPNLSISTDVITFNNEFNETHHDIIQLENYWYNMYSENNQSSYTKLNPQDSRIKIAELLTIQDEIQYVTNRIRYLVSNYDYRYKDILVVGRHITDYQNVIEPLFNESNIPAFFNVKDTMANHPLVEFITSMLRVVKNNFQYEDIMRFLRSELFIPEEETTNSWRNKIDITENVILAYGYKGAAWTREEPWVYARMDKDVDDKQENTTEEHSEDVANEVRTVISSLFNPLIKHLIKGDMTNRLALELIYEFIESNHIKKRLLTWRDRAIDDDNIELSRRHEQAWNTFIQLINEYIEVLGDSEWDLDEFLTITETAFESAEYSIVPPTLDQVTVTSMDQVRANKHKIVFYIGMNESNLPISLDNNSILDDEDRDFIQSKLMDDNKKSLTPSATELLASEPFNAYQAFGFASDFMFFSYSVKQDGGADHSLSPYLKQAAKDLSIPLYVQDKIDTTVFSENIKDLDLTIGSFNQLMNSVIHAVRLNSETNEPLHPIWYQLVDYLQETKEEHVNFVLNSLNYKNIAYPLSPELAKQLYGQNLYLSVSQLETFYKDPYNHFLRYGLLLNERKQFELTPAESGSFYHDVLDFVFSEAKRQGVAVSDLSENELVKLTDKIISSLLELPQYIVLSASNQMAFIKDLLSKTVMRRLIVTSNQLRNSSMKPYFSEMTFGLGSTKDTLPALKIPLNNESSVFLRGKIDRLDLMPKDENNVYMQIVDYKSSKMTIDYKMLKTGLSLQLLTYFDAASTLGTKLIHSIYPHATIKPLAALYSRISAPKLEYKKVKDKDPFEILSKEMKYDGLLLDYPDMLKLLDTEVMAKEYGASNYYSLYVNKKDTIKHTGRNDRLITEDELDLMLKHNRHLIKQSGVTILSGKLEIKPFYDVKFIDTISGEFHAISQFDVVLPENNYRYLPHNYTLEDHMTFLKGKYSEGDAEIESNE